MVGSVDGGEPVSFLGHADGAAAAQFNPSTPRWIAYDFDDSGRREIYVQGFTPGKPAPGARWQISTAAAAIRAGAATAASSTSLPWTAQ